ncbi:tyrosine-type recombinase/integrase [Bacillus cereus]|uniref:tyrosine-type recombinase/integrase n=1 Tax=Bacillus cereus TaxID=1396 RepID=UPI0018F69ED9|nr:tyrosine-type recombinase/integrase [Bacillus cereus]MBJ7951211.1 tyrosine-type recombinase/integrase [Bacillus cereus]
MLENIKSKGKTRNLYILMSLLDEIDDFIMEDRNKIDTEHGNLFVSQQIQNLGKPLTYLGIYSVFNVVKKKVGIEFNFHDLRHTYITQLIENGIDISVVRIIAGHEYVTTTQQYTYISNQYLENSLNGYWSKSALM